MRTELMHLLNPNNKRVFVSLPMRGHTDDEIKERQKQIFELVSNVRESPYILTFTLWQDNPPSPNNNLWYLGKSIQALGDSDIAVFSCDWAMAKGCVVERAICSIYQIPIIDEVDLIEINNIINDMDVSKVIDSVF